MKCKKCLCGRTPTKEFKINKKTIYLCPLCSYEIMTQMLKKYGLFEDFLRGFLAKHFNDSKTKKAKK